MNFVTCDHVRCGNLVYDTEPFELVYNSRLEFLLKLNPELKQICNAYHGYASHKEGLKAGINDPCKCSRCIKQKIKLDQSSKKFSEEYKKHLEVLEN